MKLWVLSSVFLMLFLVPGCGYSSPYSADYPEEKRYAVVPAQPLVGDTRAVEAVLAGVRNELARGGVLCRGGGYPRVVVEVVRVQETATGPTIAPEGVFARGTRVAVVGRAWIELRPEEEGIRDTGDMQRVVDYAPESDLRVEGVRHDQAVIRASKSLGRALAQRVLGHPTPATEPL